MFFLYFQFQLILWDQICWWNMFYYILHSRKFQSHIFPFLKPPLLAQIFSRLWFLLRGRHRWTDWDYMVLNPHKHLKWILMTTYGNTQAKLSDHNMAVLIYINLWDSLWFLLLANIKLGVSENDFRVRDRPAPRWKLQVEKKDRYPAIGLPVKSWADLDWHVHNKIWPSNFIPVRKPPKLKSLFGIISNSLRIKLYHIITLSISHK